MALKHEWHNTSTDDYDWLAFDIETTGLLAQDEVTTFTLFHNGLYHVFYQAGLWEGEIDYLSITENTSEKLGDALDEDEAGDLLVHYPCADEKELLETVIDFIEPDAHIPVNHHARKMNGEDRLYEGGFDPKNTIVCAYNGETWNDGFDVSFLRTRCAIHGLPLVFRGYPFVDPYEVFGRKTRFNTKVTDIKSLNKKPKKQFCEWVGIEVSSDDYVDDLDLALMKHGYTEDEVLEWCDMFNNGKVPKRDAKSLDEVHEILCEGEDYVSLDPLDDSRECLACFRDGDFEDLILHNIEDVRKLAHLIDLMLNYVTKDELTPKKL
jgi:DNA polymerase III epsilon subunit-like protein